MTYELAKQLKDAGFPNDWEHWNDDDDFRGFIAPTLSELIAAIGERFCKLGYDPKEYKWQAYVWNEDHSIKMVLFCKTPEEAVAKLWLALNQKSYD